MRAAQDGHTATVQALPWAGANRKLKDKDGDTVLILATASGCEAVAKLRRAPGRKFERALFFAQSGPGLATARRAASIAFFRKRHMKSSMDISTTTASARTSSTTSHLQSLSSTQQQAALPAQPPAASGMPAVPDSAPQVRTRVDGDAPRSLLCAAAREGDGNAVKPMIEAGNGGLGTVDALAPSATPPQWQPPTELLDLPNESLHQLMHFLRTANTIPAIRNVARFRAACKGLHLRIPQPIPDGMMGLIEFNRLEELKRMLVKLQRLGKDVAKELNSPAEVMTIREPELRASALTPLMAAAWLGHAELARVLLEAGASVDQAVDDRTALDLAARQGHTECVQALLTAGARVDQANATGWTPLMIAARNGHTATVQTLLCARASCKLKNKDGDTALTIAIKHECEEVAKLLRANGAST